ncbi:hypothetical protein BZZ01_11720 [Nostocales cyanobacterium HT-58-2]|nr:hypothetical protein BZZ01_11720 [Nostocales cyanobacterium HT-58-2]
MSTYVLIHGAWHGAWCWEKVVAVLEREGHKAITLDLPGHGKDTTLSQEISLQSYVERVCQVLDAQSEKVFLVGHSMGGIVISQVAEYRSEKIQMLVYLCGILLRNGQTLLQVFQQDTESLLSPNIIINADQGVSIVREDALKDIFYADCIDTDITRAKSLLRPQPLAPWGTPINITEEKFGRIPRVYIECLADRAVSPSLQKQMYTALPCRQVISMDTSHSPFFCAPEKLVACLTTL